MSSKKNKNISDTTPASVRGSELASDFTSSLAVDRRMYREDIAASIAHANMLGKQGIIPKHHADDIIAGLYKIRSEIEAGTFPWRPELEDIHMNVESRLFDLIGKVAGKLHTARSRNDQVATDFRLYVMRRAKESIAHCRRLQRALLDQAEQHRETLIPGYTHLQRAQPIVFGHTFMAYFEMLGRDAASFSAARASADACPLGSGALAGTTFHIDRAAVARELGFSRISNNSMDAVSDRDFALDYLFAAAKTMTHLSRLAEDIVIWSSQEFGFVQLSDRYSTGSSMMPQKHNPDYAELIRGKSGPVTGALMSMLMTLKGLPMTYNRDLQEDKRQLMEAADTADSALKAAAGMITELQVNTKRAAEAASDPALTATDKADRIVQQQGTPFRQAYAQVKQQLLGDPAESADDNATDAKATMPEATERDTTDMPEVSARDSVEMRNIPGGTAPGQVSAAIMRAYGELNAAKLSGEW